MRCKKSAGELGPAVALAKAALARERDLGSRPADLDRLLDRLAAVGQAQSVGAERHVRQREAPIIPGDRR